MYIVMLPTYDSGISVPLLEEFLVDMGHTFVHLTDRHDFVKRRELITTVLAAGDLTPDAMWIWGYCNARRIRVTPIAGVSHWFTGKPVGLDTWKKKIPQQKRLFHV